jgi:undecaprenyl-diphosphatase
VQGIALLPGISRLGLTFVAARWLGISSRRSFQISWLIMWPLVGADTLKMVAKGIMSGSNEQLLNLPLALVILVSSIASWYGMEVMLKMVNRNKVHYFGWYMLIPILCALMI